MYDLVITAELKLTYVVHVTPNFASTTVQVTKRCKNVPCGYWGCFCCSVLRVQFVNVL